MPNWPAPANAWKTHAPLSKAGETAKRQYEQEIQSLNEKILKFRGQSSSIKNNEQYKALLSEIAHAEGEIAGYEEKILEVMMNADSLQSQLAAAEAALKAESAEVERQKIEAAKAGEADRAAAAKAQSPEPGTCARAWMIRCWRPMTAF